MKAISQQRSCLAHPERYISHVCLKEKCECAGILCEQCIRGKHGHAKVCKIDREQPPLAYFNINSSRPQHCDYFSKVRDDIIQIWGQGNQILQRQKTKIQKTILFQLNLIRNTFVYTTPYEIEKNLKFRGSEDQDQTDQLQQGINLLRSLDKNMETIQNVNQIKANTEKVYDTITKSLKDSFVELNKNFGKLNETLNRVNIFQKAQPEVVKKENNPSNNSGKEEIKQKQKQKQKMVIEQRPKVIPPMIIPPLFKPPSSNSKLPLLTNPTIIQIPYKQTEKFCLQSNNMAKLQAINNTIKHLKIKYCRSNDEIYNFFLDNGGIQYLVIEEKRLATAAYLQLIFQCLSRIKIMVITCPNQISRCASSLKQIEVQGKGTSLERLQYCYDFRRDLEELDEDRYFPQRHFSIKFAQEPALLLPRKQNLNGDNDLGQLAYWEEPKTYLSLAETLDLQLKFNLKNIWIADLSKNNFVSLKQQKVNFKNIEEAIIGFHDHTFLPIPPIIQEELIKAPNLRSLVLIKTSHYAPTLSKMLDKLTNLDVLVLEQLQVSGDQQHITKLYHSFGVSSCPQLQKLLITDLKNVSLNFIANLAFLATLILPRSKNLKFDQGRMLASLKHLNLYGSDWNYTSLLNRLVPTKTTHLNLGMGKTEFRLISNRLKDFVLLESLCLDGMNLNELIVIIIENNQQTLRKMSLAYCQSSSIYAKMKMNLSQNLNRCRRLQTLDIHEFDMEQDLMDSYPLSLKTLIISKQKSRVKLNVRRVQSAINLCVIDLP